MDMIKSCDWIIEVVVERLDIKKIIFDKVEKYRTPGTLISSNTSGIPIHLMLEGRSEDFQAHFCGSHFFNPPRYLQLLEIIPTEKTNPEVIDFLMDYGYRFLGKKTVLCKDTPAFIANRVGVYAIMSLFHAVKEMDMTIEEVDKLTGPVLGRPKSATFRTCDVVGLDTLVHVANGLKDNCPNDEEKHLFELPDFVAKMIENNWLGSKSKQGFYKKSKNAAGEREILSLDLNTLEYREKKKASFPTLALTKNIDSLEERTKMLLNAGGKEGTFYKKMFGGIFAYVANRLPEISDDLYKIDDALKAGFGWELGPFETWSIIGIDKGIKMIESEGKKVAPWVLEMKANGVDSFYGTKDGNKTYYDVASKGHIAVPNMDDVVSLQSYKASNTVWSNADCHFLDIGD
jgi:3-hydroxyacyl-CoA dehydrogenase